VSPPIVLGPANPALPSPAAAFSPAPALSLRRAFGGAGAPVRGPSSPGGGEPSTRASPLRDIEGARARIDGLLEEARRGRTFSATELLCLQADAHRFAQTVELAARAVEHGVQGIRQALQAPV
jgi:hypothetical protein